MTGSTILADRLQAADLAVRARLNLAPEPERVALTGWPLPPREPPIRRVIPQSKGTTL